jgi:uncharacterized protein (TIGR02646 family)
MVRLHRGATPALLLEHRAEWTDRWQEIRAGRRHGDWAIPKAKKLLSDELRKLAFGKCAFCESLLDVTAYLAIDHFVAKTVRPEQAFEWSNLFPICGRCNSAKGSADHAGFLIKPDADDPESMLWLHPDSGKLQPKPGLDDAILHCVERTLELCDLQRGPLCTKRIEAMEYTIRWHERFLRQQGGDDGRLLDEWYRLIHPKTEYKFVIRHVFELRGDPRLAVKDRVDFKEYNWP